VFHRVQTWLHTSDPSAWLESLEKIEALDADIIVPGHGGVCDKGYLKEQRSFIEEWMGAVSAAIQRGLSQAEAMDEISFLDRYPMDEGISALGPGLQRMNVARLYDLFTSDRKA